MIQPLPNEGFEVDLEQVDTQFFADNGFVAIERVTTEAELVWLRSVYEQLLAEPPSGFLDGVFDLSRPYGTTDAPRLGQLLFPERFVEQFAETEMYKNAKRIALRLLEIDAADVESWSHLIFKAPLSEAETPWHQDEAYWDVHLTYQAIATWIPLDDANTENGCLWYVPGSHKGSVLVHRHHGGDPSVHVLEIDEETDTQAAVPVPLRAGGIVLHHPRCLHYSGHNTTNAMRRAWGIAFQSAPVERPEPADHPWWYEGRQAHAAGLSARGQSKVPE